MIKRFEDLTFTDDFMFCKVMQNPDLCKRLIEMILAGTIGKITYISVQHTIKNYEQAKSVRFDVLVQTENGKFYDIEMQVSNERNIPKRMRFYQAAIDISFLERRIEEMIQAIKQNEQARQEYRLMSTFEMDAMDRGAYKTKKETAKLMKQKNFDIALIKEITGLPETEIEAL